MNLRIPLLMTAAAAFLVIGTGCESAKTKTEISSLTAQNRDLSTKLEAESARANAAEAKAQAATDAAARQPQVVQAPPTTPDMGPGNMVDLRNPSSRGPRAGAAGGSPAPIEKVATKDTVLELKGDVLFDSGKATIKPSAQKELDALASTIKKQYAGKTLRIEGHTDATPLKSTSKWKSNDALAEARAKAVMAYLAKKGVPEKSMVAVSKGSSEPKSSKDQSLNRRVDVVVKNAV